METQDRCIYIGDSPLRDACGCVACELGEMMGEPYHCIQNYDQMAPFFMSLVSSSDHWLFVSSTGGLSAGRINAESALFPYTTDDKITENSDNTGRVAVLLVTQGERTAVWEPFSKCRGSYRVERNLYKSVNGDKLIFEEINHDLTLRYCYAWRFSERFGFVLTSWVENGASKQITVEVLSGLQNLLPYGATTVLQTTFSNLLNAYKRNELHPETGLGIFALSSTLTDLAEPSESLMAATAWQIGLPSPRFLLSSRQLDDFRYGRGVSEETDVRGYRGAYLAHARFDLASLETRSWHIVAEVNQDSSRVATLINLLQAERTAGASGALVPALEADIARGTADLETIIAAADGLQISADSASTAHHLTNTLFNVMRGGIFADNYVVGKADLLDFIGVRNRRLLSEQAAFFDALPDNLDYPQLVALATETGEQSLMRLCSGYLPLTFSRRHGDPSRPWNRFSINLKKPDGSRKLDYEGNWRDIFQNWEPLAWSYPEYVEGMISTFVNATTADGYNPYRVTSAGIEWEAPAPDDPWANIGYWSDHQIIYLQKLLEISASVHPGRLERLLHARIFSYANVPYRIKPYVALVADWYDTIDFDRGLDERIAGLVEEMGTDGKLMLTAGGRVAHVNLVEKLLILLLAKLGNFVPEGGIWMNTQRPEWNDANNALVGKGLSVVTAGYLRRFVVFLYGLLSGDPSQAVEVSAEVRELFEAMRAILGAHEGALKGGFCDRRRRAVMDELGKASSDYRLRLYDQGLSGDVVGIDRASLLGFLTLAQHHIEHTLHANQRSDGLYHAYNVLRLGDGVASIDRLNEMLEGQVSILSSGMLTSEEALDVLRVLRQSRLYRADQHSYLLYPDRELPGFLEKNRISPERVADLALVARLGADQDSTLIARDANGIYHFNGTFRNAGDVQRALDTLMGRPDYAALVAAERESLLALFEEVFRHSAFTGRSGTFFAYEGLGSIYWHMVGKLLVAAQEVLAHAVVAGASEETTKALSAIFHDIRLGLGFNKTAEDYGAFPADPYSHTPAGQGAKQPGMTGAVKEELLARMAELGVVVENGALGFVPRLLRSAELLHEPTSFAYLAVGGQRRSLDIPADALAFTVCQVPVVYVAGEAPQIEAALSDGSTIAIPGQTLDTALSAHIFRRDGYVRRLTVHIGSLRSARHAAQ
jgi:hypothetical protein